MRVCPKCGHTENLYWQQSRYVANQMFMRQEDFEREYPILWEKLKNSKTPILKGNFMYIKGRKAYVKRWESVGGVFESHYESNTVKKAMGLSINRWAKKQFTIRSKAQSKLIDWNGKQK